MERVNFPVASVAVPKFEFLNYTETLGSGAFPWSTTVPEITTCANKAVGITNAKVSAAHG